MSAQPSEPCRIPDHYNSYAFTVRPRNGVQSDSDLQIAILKWCQKQDYYFLCAEKEEEERHLHGQIWLQEGRKKGAIVKSLVRIQEQNDPDWSSASQKVLSAGVKIGYSSDFVENYLSKEDNWLLNNPPPTNLEHLYYPSIEEQNKVKNKANAVDLTYHRLLELWKDYEKYTFRNKDQPITKHAIGEFLYTVMFCKKLIKVQPDSRKRLQTRDCLYHYIIGHPCGDRTEKWRDMFTTQKEKDDRKEKNNLLEELSNSKMMPSIEEIQLYK